MDEPLYRIFIVLILIIAAVSAGCTDAGSVSSPVTPSPAPEMISTPAVLKNTTIPPAPAPAITAGATTAPAQAKVFGTYRWVEYRNNITQTLPPNPRYQWEMHERVECSTGTYKGIPAIHYTITETADYPEWIGTVLTHTPNGSIIVTERYYEASTNAFLGGTTTAAIKGIAKPPADLPPGEQFSREDRPSYEMGITPFGGMNITLTDTGTEPVTVPAGTYPHARTYTGAFRDGTPVTFWVAPGIPVPVRYLIPNKYLDGEDPLQSYELIGWG